jgi:2-alkyl-3-oxoalkanoate reductase
MKVFIAGATGVLGRRLVALFAQRGHEVVGLARTPTKAERVRSLGGRPAAASLFDADALARAAGGADVVIHAATAITVGTGSRRRNAWEPNDRVRRDGTRALTAAAARVGARRYLQQSVAWVLRNRGRGRFYDERTPPDPPALVRSAVDAERIAGEAGGRHGFSVGILRGGSFYGPDTFTRGMAALLHARRMPIIGSGEFLVAPIHADDMARAFVLAAESGADGIWHVIDDEPVAFAQLLRHLAGAIGAPAPRHVPVWLARLMLGGHVVDSLTTSMHTSNARIRRELGWAPQYPTYREGIAATIAEWAHERREGGEPPA